MYVLNYVMALKFSVKFKMPNLYASPQPNILNLKYSFVWSYNKYIFFKKQSVKSYLKECKIIVSSLIDLKHRKKRNFQFSFHDLLGIVC